MIFSGQIVTQHFLTAFCVTEAELSGGKRTLAPSSVVSPQ